MISSLNGSKNTQTSTKYKRGKKLLMISFLLVGIFFIGSTIKASEGFSLSDAVNSTNSKIKEAKHLPTSQGDPDKALTNTIQGATNYITGVAAGVAILFVVINAGKLVFALGSADDITTAKKGLMWSLGGLVLIMFAFVIAKTVISLTFSGEEAEGGGGGAAKTTVRTEDDGPGR